jgi:hypothetical protein
MKTRIGLIAFLLWVSARVFGGEDITSTRILSWDLGAANATNAQARVAVLETNTATEAQGDEADTAFGWGDHATAGYAGTGDLAAIEVDLAVLGTGKADVVHTHVWADLTNGSTGNQRVTGEWLFDNLQVPVVTNATVVDGSNIYGRLLVRQYGATEVWPSEVLGWYAFKTVATGDPVFSWLFTNSAGAELYCNGSFWEIDWSGFYYFTRYTSLAGLYSQNTELPDPPTGLVEVVSYPFFGSATLGALSVGGDPAAYGLFFPENGNYIDTSGSTDFFTADGSNVWCAGSLADVDLIIYGTNTVTGKTHTNVVGNYVGDSFSATVTNLPWGIWPTYAQVPVTNWVLVRDYLTNLVDRVEALE